ncbi:CTP:molybdopterin cytidylyltransferase [Marinobacterium lacunae]|uniref:CTP:molybdopterin cytidylyltransferase n=1 Tax=Marinobacterium lacunae TaxID=1232683 RepID=A0A081FV95_9GAMM|nr:nucleotidyltransferase family protein [Marinobacterium lacunae]KEA62450.1 CTP:molybdopterin cytidylyltransferase [Marinobacterium lacunae]
MNIAALVLAAGAGSRFGGRKQLALLEDRALVQHALQPLLPRFEHHLFCVIGAYADEVRPLVEGYARVIEHPDWSQGLGTSIARGVRAIADDDYDGVLITLADLACLDTEHYRQLVERFDGQCIVASHYAGKTAVPALFPKALFAQLMRLEGDRGARNLLRDNADRVVTLPMPTASQDIDTPEDLLALAKGPWR